ncbi:hypothetical protein LINPERHAP1_LOCUS38330 [Linum perenne]
MKCWCLVQVLRTSFYNFVTFSSFVTFLFTFSEYIRNIFSFCFVIIHYIHVKT